MSTDTAGGNDELRLARISSESVHAATGREWDEWLRELDSAGAADWSHKEIVAYLEREHSDLTTGWWRQALTVGYEQARGRRIEGETAYAGFQVGVQRTVAATVKEAWELITSRPELWLGDGVSVAFEEGQRYEVPPVEGDSGARGEVRVVKPGERLRMTWQSGSWPAAATLQLTLVESRPGRTAVQAHLEKLPDADAREAMRAHWRKALQRLATAAG